MDMRRPRRPRHLPSQEEGRRTVKIPNVEGDGPVYPDISPEDNDALIDRLELENEILRSVNEVLIGASLKNLASREKALLIDHLRQTTSHPLRELTHGSSPTCVNASFSNTLLSYNSTAWQRLSCKTLACLPIARTPLLRAQC